MKTLIGVNTLTSIEHPVYSNHFQFAYRLGKHYPDDAFAVFHPKRMPIDRMRNQCAKLALENEFDYILFIDDDVVIPFDGFTKLLKTKADVAAGWTIIRGWPFQNMFFRHPDRNKHLLHHVKDSEFTRGEVIDVDAVGFSFCLLSVPFLKKVNPPYFVTGTYNTEDIYYCMKARATAPDCRIVVDTSIETAHIMGPEVIAPWNKESYARYFKETFPEMAQDERPEDRGEDYLRMVHGT